MKLYLLTQDENNGYDTYDSMVVAAMDVDTAKTILPHENDSWGQSWSTWASSPNNVTVTYIGEAAPNIEQGVVLASFNAG